MADTKDIGTLLTEILTEMRLQNQYTQKLVRQHQANDPEDPLFSVNEAAAYCKVSRQTIAVWIRNGRLSKVARGCKVGILKSTLDMITR